MANQDEVRGVSLSRPLSFGTDSATRFKLPMLLTARPGNVGVQIDAHRAMNLFSHPRSVKFTSQFHGGMYENGSLENYSRVVERTAQRARLLQDKLDKLRDREQYLLEDEAKRKQRRIQREASRQRRFWQIHQAAKQADERALETAAAIAMQKVVRGAFARRAAQVLRQVRKTNEAASMLQRAMKAYVSRQELAQERERRAREEDERRELEIHSAAAVLQRQVRKRLKAVQEAHQQAALATFTEDEEAEDEIDGKSDEMASTSGIPSLSAELAADEKIITDALSRGISLDLLFSDEEDNESALSTNSTSSSSIPRIEPISTTQTIHPQPPVSRNTAIRRPMSIKRVGGGYRTKLLPHPKSSEPEATDSNPAPATSHITQESSRLQETVATSSTITSEEFLRHSRHSPTMPQTALSPTLIATTRSIATPQKSENDGLRSSSPVQANVSPYAIPQRLHYHT